MDPADQPPPGEPGSAPQAPRPAAPAPENRPLLFEKEAQSVDRSAGLAEEDLGPIGPPPLEVPATGGRGRILFGLVAFVGLLVVGATVVTLLLMGSAAGRVTFSKEAYNQASGNCRFGTPITEAAPADRFFMMAYFNDTLAPQQTYTLSITRDGVPFGTQDATTDRDFQCYVEADALGPLGAGTYQFTFTYQGKVEAQGSITIK
jgi:hypothetical protein